MNKSSNTMTHVGALGMSHIFRRNHTPVCTAVGRLQIVDYARQAVIPAALDEPKVEHSSQLSDALTVVFVGDGYDRIRTILLRDRCYVFEPRQRHLQLGEVHCLGLVDL